MRGHYNEINDLSRGGINDAFSWRSVTHQDSHVESLLPQFALPCFQMTLSVLARVPAHFRLQMHGDLWMRRRNR
jgi:hypothetical protein